MTSPYLDHPPLTTFERRLIDAVDRLDRALRAVPPRHHTRDLCRALHDAEGVRAEARRRGWTPLEPR